MSIESLRLKGFKSFGNPCDFTFTKGFTAIVGPNGSGKSNILDALRWILGEGSNSALRILRQSDLLFQGSISTPPAKEAEVTLTLTSGPGMDQRSILKRLYSAEDGGSLQLDGDRILVQDLNNVKSRFSLEGAGFAFIGQGEVSAAIHQRPRERRAQLDLLFGIDRYRDRRDDALKRMEDATEEMRRIQTLIQELEARRAEIASEVEVAVKAQSILDSLEIMRRDFYFSRRFALESEASGLRSKQKLLKIRLDMAGLWREFWRGAVKRDEERLLSLGFDEGAFTARSSELAQRKDGFKRQAFQASTHIRTILENRAALTEEREKNAEQERALREEQKRAASEEAGQREQVKKCRSALEARLKELEEGKAHFERERMRRQTLRDELAERRLSLSRTEAELRALSSSEATEDSLKSMTEERDRRAQAGEKLVQKLEELEGKREKLLDGHTSVYALCQKHAATLQQMRRERARLEGELDGLRDSAAGSLYPRPVQMLLSAAKLGRMRSRPEILAEAFSCPSNIAVAIEAYLGARQFWLLVHTMEEAQEGIELLKQRQGGRATYLPLERCRPRDRDFRFKLPTKGVVGWVMDLIEPRGPWASACAHLMGDLLVVEDYALGSSLTKQGARFPIVTLEGEVFAPTGTVSGGQTQQKGSAIAHNQQIAELGDALDALQMKIKAQERTLRDAEAEEREAAGKLDALTGELERVRAEAASEQRALTALEASLERLTSESERNLEQAKSLEVEVKTAKDRISELEAELAKLGDLPDEDNPDAALAPLRSELSLAEERLRGTVTLLDRIGREHQALLARSATLEDELKAGREEEAEKRALLGSLGREILSVHKEEQELKRRFEEERERVQRAHLRLERLRARSGRAESVVTERSAEIAAAGERLAALENELHQLTELWDEKYPYNYDAAQARNMEGKQDPTGKGLAALTTSLRRLERELKALGPYNLGALSEDTSLTERLDFLTEQLSDVRSGIDELRKLIQDTDTQVEATFTAAMSEIDSRFNALFQRLFGGGEARLTLQDGEDIWERGVEIYARPPGKKLQNISQLSGGEQSLTAIAQLFSALEVAKVPIAVLDEVDAALDEYNLIRFADLAKEYSRSLQLLVMTHRRTTMERADLIYGVTMVEPGLTKIVGIDVENYR
ncbi:MAG: chromosome segregation protein SMC [Synergistaceae bacterium]|nr:chromosome segregation protein SMC [Synergistaceae bacterium]